LAKAMKESEAATLQKEIE